MHAECSTVSRIVILCLKLPHRDRNGFGFFPRSPSLHLTQSNFRPHIKAFPAWLHTTSHFDLLIWTYIYNTVIRNTKTLTTPTRSSLRSQTVQFPKQHIRKIGLVVFDSSKCSRSVFGRALMIFMTLVPKLPGLGASLNKNYAEPHTWPRPGHPVMLHMCT